MTGVERIAAERQRQIDVEGWTPEHDDKHINGELAEAAACYANPTIAVDPRISTPEGWPWAAGWWKPGIDYRNQFIRHSSLHGHVEGRIRDLVKAGALLAAEIDRLQRAKEKL